MVSRQYSDEDVRLHLQALGIAQFEHYYTAKEALAAFNKNGRSSERTAAQEEYILEQTVGGDLINAHPGQIWRNDLFP